MNRLFVPCCLALLFAAGCNNNNNSAVSFAFSRPEHLDFACFAPYSRGTALHGDYAILPRSCCTQYDPSMYRLNPCAEGQSGNCEPLNPQREDDGKTGMHPECTAVDGVAVDTPVLHALVTQSTRGEVAAVDLSKNRVLDSDALTPGFTFLDTGGLPSAIVAPSEQLRRPKTDVKLGTPWTYVTSAEENQVRAVPTCRFRSGVACGPDLADRNSSTAPAAQREYALRQRVALPASPEDMIRGPDDALWITLPDLGLIARVQASLDPSDAFVVDAASQRPAPPELFRVPPAPNVTLPEPVGETEEYGATCGLKTPFDSARLKLPLAQRLPPTNSAKPTRMRFDADSGLLLVADREAPVLYAFRLGEDGALTALGALPTGQTVREFVITPAVPKLSTENLLALTAPPEDQAGETLRYLYAIDGLGTVMVFGFDAGKEGGLPTLTPLLAPESGAVGTPYRDRIGIPPNPSIAVTLEVVDTRSQSDYVCGQEGIDQLRERRGVLREKLKQGGGLTDEESREYARVSARQTVYDTADPAYMRGVFVVVASLSGTLSVIDVHDLDSLCRAQKFCCASNGEPKLANDVPAGCTSKEALDLPRSNDLQRSLALRRHTLRRRFAGPQKAEVASSNLLQPVSCGVGWLSEPTPQLTPLVCGSADPWLTGSETWIVTFEGALPNSAMASASLEVVDAATQTLALNAPAQFNMCERGLQDGDLLAVIGQAPEPLRANCPDPTADNPPTFQIVEASAQRLVMTPRPPAVEGESEADLARRKQELFDRVRGCYPDFVGAELRANGFIVIGQSGTYLHRMTTNEAGRCVLDDTKDPLFNARMVEDTVTLVTRAADGSESRSDTKTEVFRNPYVAFALAPPQNGALGIARQTSINVSQASAPQQLPIVVSGDQVTDVLPSTLQYLPEVGYLFLLDSAGQGLRRYTLRPFARDDKVIAR